MSGTLIAAPKFDADQINVLQKAYDYGKSSDYGWTLAAMSWRESSAGKNLVNWNDPSFGPFHNLITTVAKRENTNDPLEMLTIAQRLLVDFDYAASHAVKELDFWKGVHKNNWRSMWASYNAGFGWKGARGQAYADDILSKIQYLKSNGVINIK